MASGFTSNGTDLDSVFAAHTSGGTIITGFKTGAQDLGSRYQLYTSGAHASNVGMTSNGTDLGQLFAQIGGGAPFSVGATPSSRTASSGTALATTVSVSNGTPSYTYAWVKTTDGGAGSTCSNTASGSPTFTGSGGIHVLKTDVWTCTVHDSASHVGTCTFSGSWIS